MTDSPASTLTDTSDMIAVHRVFRDAVGSAVRLIDSVAPADARRREIVASYFDTVLRLLHAHHEGEDELLTPMLLDRCSPSEQSTVAIVAEQHGSVEAEIAAVERALGAWQSDPTAGTALKNEIGALSASLQHHLDDEETWLLPIAARHVSAAEWAALPEHSMRRFDGDKPWLVLGLVREHFDEQQLAAMDAAMPPPLLGHWRSEGKQLFEGFVSELRSYDAS